MLMGNGGKSGDIRVFGGFGDEDEAVGVQRFQNPMDGLSCYAAGKLGTTYRGSIGANERRCCFAGRKRESERVKQGNP